MHMYVCFLIEKEGAIQCLDSCVNFPYKFKCSFSLRVLTKMSVSFNLNLSNSFIPRLNATKSKD